MGFEKLRIENRDYFFNIFGCKGVFWYRVLSKGIRGW